MKSAKTKAKTKTKLTAQFDAAVKSLAKGRDLLFIDDDKNFLNGVTQAATKFEAGSLNLRTIRIPPTSGVQSIENKILSEFSNGLPDVIVIDQRMKRVTAQDLVTWIRDVLALDDPRLRYLPIIVMSQNADVGKDAAVIEAGANAFALKIDSLAEKQSIFFHMLLFDLPWIEDRVEDRKWDDLQRNVGDLIAEGKSIAEVASEVSDFISKNMSTIAFYVRKPTQGNEYELEFIGGWNGFSAPNTLDARKVPILKRTLDNGGEPLRINSLSAEDSGRSNIGGLIIRKHFLGIAIVENGESRGTITTYRDATDRPFRLRDEHYIRHLALQFAYLLQRERDQRQITARQRLFAEYFSLLTTQFEADRIVECLADFLTNVFGSEGRKVSVTVALIEPGKRALRRITRGTLKVKVSHDDVLFQAIDAEPEDWKSTIKNNPESRSILLPMDSGSTTVGAFFIEVDLPGRFSPDDINFLETVAGVTANRIVSYRVRRFMIDMMTVVNALARPGGPTRSTEDILAPVFEALWSFVGYRSLLYLLPGPNTDAPWRIERVHTEENRATSNDDLVEKWRMQFDKNWTETYARRVLLLDNRSNYTDDPAVIANDADAQGEQSLSMLVLPFRPEDGLVRAAIGLTFVWRRSLNEFQRGILEQAGGFIAAILSVSQSLNFAFEEKTVAGQFAILGKAMAMFRHNVRNEFGTLQNELALLELDHPGNEHVDNLNDKLDQIVWNIEVGSRRLVKKPEPTPVNIHSLVSQVASRLKSHRFARILELEVEEIVPANVSELVADAEIVANILELVGQNAVEAIESSATARPGRIVLEVRQLDKHIAFIVTDNGPGIPRGLVSRLFGMGVTTKPLGTGFGLAFARSRAREISGELVYEAASNGGAQFILTVPFNTSNETRVS